MGEQMKGFADSRAFNTILSAIAALGTIIGALALFAGWISAGTSNAHDIQMLQSQFTALSAQISALGDKIDHGPRADQLTEIVNHLHAIDGRLDSDERRQADDEQTLVRSATKIESIQNSSEAALRGHPR
jgi:outer membrane murein-binding lipoprotein Lpp